MQPIPPDILAAAERLLYHNELLIEQCDRWLSAEEGNRNMMRKIEERNRRLRKEKAIAMRKKLNPLNLLKIFKK